MRAVLKTVRLDPDLKTPYRKYSLGMKQRLGIAAAIMEDRTSFFSTSPSMPSTKKAWPW
ncbi:MAG: hypothetical protein ACLT98_10065 [Eggerthellaceae bacterium]